MKKLKLIVLLFLGISTVLVSCKDDDDSAPTPTPINNNPILTNKVWEIDSTIMIVNILNTTDTIDSTYTVMPVGVSNWSIDFNADKTGSTVGTAFGDNNFDWSFSNQQSVVTLDFTLPDTSFSQFYILTVGDSTLTGTVSSITIPIQNGTTVDTAYGDLIEFWKRQN